MSEITTDGVVKQIIEAFIKVCKGSIQEYVIALYLRGSYPRGDWVFGLSDLDFYLIITDDILEKRMRKTKFVSIMKDFFRQIVKEYPDFFITFSYDNLKKVTNEKCKAYIMSLDSVLLVGEDILKEFPEPEMDELEHYGRRMVIYLCDYWMRSPDLQSAIKTRNDAIRIAQYMLLKIAQNALFIKGIIVFEKRDVVREFEDSYHFFKLKHLVREAYYIRSHWPLIQTNTKRLEKFKRNATPFPMIFSRYVKKHSKP